MDAAREHLGWIQQQPAPATPLRVLNVCGGHERALTDAGLRSLLPPWLQLVPGPGCPVCVCPEEAIAAAIQMALDHPLTLLAFGDMLRVPVSGSAQISTLLAARAAGADVRAIASPLEALSIARSLASRPVVFFVAGFETTLAPVAAMLAGPLPENLFLLLAGRRTWPAVAHLLQAAPQAFDALIAPGHVAAVMGAAEWQFVASQYQRPVAVAGFDAASLLLALRQLLHRLQQGQADLDNAYPEVVSANGNPRARALLDQAFCSVDAHWRGIGMLPASGFALQPHYQRHDALARFPVAARPAARDMPPGCDCADVLLARKLPSECRLYGRGCTPDHPIGPCMVSDEGACHIWWQAGERGQARRSTG